MDRLRQVLLAFGGFVFVLALGASFAIPSRTDAETRRAPTGDSASGDGSDGDPVEAPDEAPREQVHFVEPARDLPPVTAAATRVLDVLAEVPARFRADKNLYISMLGRFFPDVAAFPSRIADSLPHWPRD